MNRDPRAFAAAQCTPRPRPGKRRDLGSVLQIDSLQTLHGAQPCYYAAPATCPFTLYIPRAPLKPGQKLYPLKPSAP